MKLKKFNRSAFVQPLLGLAVSALLGNPPSAFASEPLRFLANGTLTHLQIGDFEMPIQTKQRSGFSLLWFEVQLISGPNYG